MTLQCWRRSAPHPVPRCHSHNHAPAPQVARACSPATSDHADNLDFCCSSLPPVPSFTSSCPNRSFLFPSTRLIMDQLKDAAMDYLKNMTGGNNQNQQGTTQGNVNTTDTTNQQGSSSGGGFMSGLTDKFNSAAGGGRESEKNEDMLDKAIDAVQEHVLKQGPQDNESAIEQAKDEQISDFLRGQYKGATGSEMPIKDKPTKF